MAKPHCTAAMRETSATSSRAPVLLSQGGFRLAVHRAGWTLLITEGRDPTALREGADAKASALEMYPKNSIGDFRWEYFVPRGWFGWLWCSNTCSHPAQPSPGALAHHQAGNSMPRAYPTVEFVAGHILSSCKQASCNEMRPYVACKSWHSWSEARFLLSRGYGVPLGHR